MESRMMKPGQLLTMLLVAWTSMMMGCGDLRTNPTEGYEDLTTSSVPPHDNKPRPQSYLESIFQIKHETFLTFVEGKQASYEIASYLRMSGVEYELVAKGLPEGATFAKSPESPNKYILTWYPTPGTLADQEFRRPLQFYIEIKVLKTSDPVAAQVMKEIGHDRLVDMLLVRTEDQPIVEKVELASDTLAEGEAMAFTVVVKDLGAYQNRQPRLLVAQEFGASQEAVKVDGAPFVKVGQTPQSLGEGRFKFSATFDGRNLSLPTSGGDLIPARFNLVVLSPSGLTAADQTVEIKIMRRPEPVSGEEATTKATEKPAQGAKK